MEFMEFSHRHAKAIIESAPSLCERYRQLTDAIRSITDDELIHDFTQKKKERAQRGTQFKSMTPSINSILKERMLAIDGWQAEVNIFNDNDAIGNTEWRLDFACDNALCVEVAFNHGEAIAWNLLKPVLSCELNHVEKAIQGQIGIYICATDDMKIAANIDSASGSYEKVLRYLNPMMNQLTIPMMIIGLKPFKTFKINKRTEIVRSKFTLDESLSGKKVSITPIDNYTMFTGTVISIEHIAVNGIAIKVQKTRNNIRTFTKEEIRFLEIES